MKKIKFNIIALVAALAIAGCSKNHLSLVPKDQLTESTTFTSYNNIKTYAWQFYEVFPAYDRTLQNIEWDGDLFMQSVPNSQSAWAWQRVTIPSSSSNYTAPFANIRAINIMLDNLETSPLADVDKNHWKSVGYFFKAYNYMNLVAKYGDITWVEHALKDNDEETLFGPRTPRNEVTKHILDMLQFAETNIKAAGDGANTINVNVVRALISRFGLFEGTWRKYHGLGDAQTYLQASANASAKLITAFPALHANYDELFNSESLAGNKEVLLYKNYVVTQSTHAASTWPRSSSGRWDLTKKAVDMYLMTDGQTRWTSPLFISDKDPYDEFRNRDSRLYYTVPPPFKVNAPGSTSNFTFTGVAKDSSYFSLMARLSPNGLKTLPTTNWNGFVVRQEPHFADFTGGQPYNITYSGYRFYKLSSKLNTGISSADINDAPIFRMGEVLVNYAEAMYELGSFDQSVCDATINKLRKRAGVATLSLGAIPDDPTRDAGVTPVLWEIRRERAVELMGEGFRFDDLRRWKKMDYATERKLGRWIKRSDYGNAIPLLNGATEGYIDYFGQAPTPFPDYYYLYPIPSDQIVLNPKITQNPDWK